MTTKSVDLPHLRNVVLAGHAGSGKTTLAEQLLFRTGAVPRPGKVDEGTASLDFEPEEQKRHESLSRLTRRRGHARHPARHARLCRLRRGSDRGLRRCRRGALRDGRLDGCRIGAGERRVAGADQRSGGLLLHQQVRPRERRADQRAGRAAHRVRHQDRAPPPGDRCGRIVQRLRRPGPSQGVAVGRQTGGRDPDPRRADRRGRPPAGPAAGGRCGGGRRRPHQVPRGRGDQRSGARGVPAKGRQGVGPCAGARRQRREGRRAARTARCVRALPAIARRRATGDRSRCASSRRRPTRSSGA